MDLTKNIISEEKFNNLFLIFFAGLFGFMFWSGYLGHQDLSKVLNTENALKLEVLEYKTKYLQLSKVYTGKNSETQQNYVTILALEDTPTDKQTKQTIESNFGFTKITGLLSHPSFVITDKTRAFWKSQLYLEFFYSTFGLIILCFFYLILIRSINIQKNKLFSIGIGKTFQILAAYLYLGFFLDMILYGRLMLFLNKTYYLGESITGGGSDETLYLGTALFFIGIIIQRASTLQEEQDLTI